MKRLIALWVVFMGVFLVGMAFGRLTLPNKTPTPLEVVDKCEHEGKCYIETWIEVTVEDYIGLDIGDEYERSGE